MDKAEEIYQQLTGVDLEMQRRIWDERGKGYYGEYLVFRELLFRVPGSSKLLMNLQVPTTTGKSTEVDLLMIHETGIYIFEIKYYKGTIYGNTAEEYWTQYFRTAENHVFKNPVRQNGYHARAICHLMPEVPVYSVVVFANDDCKLRIEGGEGSNYLVVTTLDRLIDDLYFFINRQMVRYSMGDIDCFFQTLKPYSPLKDFKVPLDESTIIPFYEYISQIKNHMDNCLFRAQKESEQAVCSANNRLEQAIQNLRKRKRQWVGACIAAVLCCIGLGTLFCGVYKYACDTRVATAQTELQAMQKNFQHVDAYGDPYLQLVDGLIQVSDVQLSMSKDLKNTAVFSCTLSNTGEEYGILLNENTKYIIMMADGTVQEYDMFGERLHYSMAGNRLSGSADTYLAKHSGTLEPLEIYGVGNVADIVYIKITNVSLWKWQVNYNNSLKDGLELKLYSKE